MSDEEKDDSIPNAKPSSKQLFTRLPPLDNPKSLLSSDPSKIYTIQDPSKKQSSLHVAIRCRPLLKHENKANFYEIVRVMDKKVEVFDSNGNSS